MGGGWSQEKVAGPTFPHLPTRMDQHKIKAILVQAQHDPLGYFDGPLQKKTPQIKEDFLDFQGSVELDSSLFHGFGWVLHPSGGAQQCFAGMVALTPGRGLWQGWPSPPLLSSISLLAEINCIFFLDRKGAVFLKISSLPAVCSAEFLSAESQLPGSGWKVLGVTIEPP